MLKNGNPSLNVELSCVVPISTQGIQVLPSQSLARLNLTYYLKGCEKEKYSIEAVSERRQEKNHSEVLIVVMIL